MYQFSPMTERIGRMRERYRTTIVNLDSERTRIITHFYQQSEHRNEPRAIAKAKSLLEVISKMTIRVEDEELIVGNIATQYKGTTLWPEYCGCGWLYDELSNGEFDSRHAQDEPMTISKEDREYFWTVKDFWAENALTRKLDAMMPDGYDSIVDSQVFTFRKKGQGNMPTGHLSPNYQKVIDSGFGAIRREAQEKIDAMYTESAPMSCCHIGPNDSGKYIFYKSVQIVCDAAILLAKRYAQACREKAEQAKGARREELLDMAGSLDYIMDQPCRTFRDAVQATFLYQVLMTLDGNLHGLSFGRFDQYTWPYLKRDMELGKLTREQAQEIVDNFYLKVSELYNARSKKVTEGTGAFSTFQNITIGGVDKQGEDATNLVTYLCLEAPARLHTHEPPVSLRISHKMPTELWSCALATSKIVGGIPGFYNDKGIIKAMMAHGYALEDARNYCIIGCQEIGGSGNDYTASGGVHAKPATNLGALIDLAINNGINPMNGKKVAPDTGYLYEWTSFEQCKEAYVKLIRYFVPWHISLNNFMEYTTMREMPIPVLSASIDGCMDKGVDCTAGGAKYNSYGTSLIGIGTLIDSFNAIRYMVFDKKLCTGRELYDAIMANWEGHEELRQRIRTEVPHYGNNDTYADELADWIFRVYIDELEKGKGARGGFFKTGLFTASVHIPTGRDAWATPDGRYAGTPLSDAMSPVQEMDKEGPTSIVLSATKIDQSRYINGTALNLKFHPRSVNTEADEEKLRKILNVYFERGGFELQYNIISSDTMRAAQKDPQAYRDLVVRIAGFSAYFVELHKNLQDDLILRTDNDLN